MSEINLSGGEITILKCLASTGSQMDGETVMHRAGGIEEAELLDALQGLIAVGYIDCTRDSIRTVAEMLAASYRINPSYARDLEEVLDPRRHQERNRPRRRRRE